MRRAQMMLRHGAMLLVLLLSCGSCALWAFETSMEISQADLQARTVKLFPQHSTTPYAKVVLSDPLVQLHPKENQLALALTVQLFLGDLPLGHTRAEVVGRLEYTPDSGEFYLRDARAANLDLSRLAPELAPAVENSINELVRGVLDHHPLYVLDEQDARQRMMKRRMKSVEVRDGRLLIFFDM